MAASLTLSGASKSGSPAPAEASDHVLARRPQLAQLSASAARAADGSTRASAADWANMEQNSRKEGLNSRGGVRAGARGATFAAGL